MLQTEYFEENFTVFTVLWCLRQSMLEGAPLGTIMNWIETPLICIFKKIRTTQHAPYAALITQTVNQAIMIQKQLEKPSKKVIIEKNILEGLISVSETWHKLNNFKVEINGKIITNSISKLIYSFRSRHIWMQVSHKIIINTR